MRPAIRARQQELDALRLTPHHDRRVASPVSTVTPGAPSPGAIETSLDPFRAWNSG